MQRLPAPPLPAWLGAMLPFERFCTTVCARPGDAPLAMHVMHAVVPARGAPAGATSPAVNVVLLHGNPTWGFLYRRVAAELARPEGESGDGAPRLELFMPDLIGLGFSERPRSVRDHTLEQHVGWLRSFLEPLAGERLVVVLQDWGGPIGLGALAELAPKRVGLVVLNTVVSPPRPGFRPKAFHRFARLPLVSDFAFRLLGFPQAGLALAQGDRTSIRGAVARAYRYPLRRVADNAAPLALARMVPDAASHPSIPALARCQRYVETFTGPAAIVWGDRDPVLGGVRTWIEKLLPHAPVTRTRAGHFLQEEVPDAIAAAVRNVARELVRAA